MKHLKWVLALVLFGGSCGEAVDTANRPTGQTECLTVYSGGQPVATFKGKRDFTRNGERYSFHDTQKGIVSIHADWVSVPCP